jgi:hypothetical protein
MLASLLLVSTLLMPTTLDEGLTQSGASDRDLEKLGKDVVSLFDAMLVDDRSEQAELIEKLEAGLAKLHKKAKVSHPSTYYLGDWDKLLELSKPTKTLKSKSGRGFFKHTFEQGGDDPVVGMLLSLPKEYAKTKALFPVIIGLKPEMGGSGKSLVEAVSVRATTLYGDLMTDHIVLIPLGPESGKGKRALATETKGSWLLIDNLYTFFPSFRVLFEQVRFDRSRVVLDGWGEAGKDAVALATSAPSFFAGVINRGGEVGVEAALLENLFGGRLLYVTGTESEDHDLSVLDEEIEGVEIQSIDSEGSVFEPSEEGRAAIKSWIEGTVKNLAPSEIRFKITADHFAAVNWCKAENVTRRATASPNDKDFPRISAKINRAKNSIEFDTVNVKEMQIFLNDALLDLSKTVTIHVNGEEKFKRAPRAGLLTMLENRFYNDSGDYGLYTFKVPISDISANVPGRDG